MSCPKRPSSWLQRRRMSLSESESLPPDAGSRARVGVLGLFVYDRFHRLGIGSSLLHVLMASGQRLHLLQRLVSVVCNNEAALRFYLKSGFQIEGRLAGGLRHGGRFHDAYLMSLRGHKLVAARPFDARFKSD
jgi:RimJ/RimL family protein N-acetyltransferase